MLSPNFEVGVLLPVNAGQFISGSFIYPFFPSAYGLNGIYAVITLQSFSASFLYKMKFSF